MPFFTPFFTLGRCENGCDMRKVKGTIQKGGRYYANVKIPAELRDSYGREMYRESLRTSDPATAEVKVGGIRAALHAEREQARAQAELERLIGALNPEQKKLFKDAGGLSGLLRRFEKGKAGLKFIEAGTPDREEGVSRDEHAIEVASHEAASNALAQQVDRDRQVLQLVGQDLGSPEAPREGSHSLSDVVDDYAPSVDPQTAEAARTAVRRFTELHGDIALRQIEARHLRDFLDTVKKLPKVQSGKRRQMVMLEMIADADAKSAERIGFTTQQKSLNLLKALMSHAVGQGVLDANPWVNIKLKAPKSKHSAKAPRRPFTGGEVRRILDHVKASDAPQYREETVDRWAPWVAAYHGLRIQEVCQLKAGNFAVRDGVWSMEITDEGAGQRAKTRASVRWVPVHPVLEAEGLRTLVEKRAPERFAFRYWHRYKRRMSDLEPDSRGRVSGAYAKRFAHLLNQLDLSEPELVFHSFRHRIQDAADNAGIPESHRRYLTGRANADAVEGAYGQGASMSALYESLKRVDPLA